MVECDACEDEVLHVWRHRAITETVTHREQRWVCADCHPKLASTLRTETTAETDATTETTADPETDTAGTPEEQVVVTDGGQFACPTCGGETVNGQGVFGCLSCSWTGVS
jgi:ribosomal protein L37AE/L43A